MLIKAMIDKPKSLAWINRYEGVIDSFWPDLKKFLKLDASQEKIFENYLTVYQKEKAREITFKLFGNQKDPKHIVIALHGWMHSAEAWYPLIMQARLEKQDCLIISYDQFGFGHDENRHSDRIDIGKMIVDIENVTKYFRKTYPDAAIHLVGHSMSGAMLGIFANYNKQQNLVQSYHALAPAIAACRKNIFDLRKAKCKIDFLETMWYIGMSPSTKINAKKYSLAIITNIPAIIELMLYAYRNYLALLETVKVPFYMSACGRDICVNIKDFELLHQSLSKEQQSEQMHYRFFPEAYHLPAQSREKEFVNSMLIEDLSSHEHKSI